MLDIQIDEKHVNELLERAINERVEELAKEKYFITMQELSEYVNLSIPVIQDRLILNGLPHYKQGTKYLFRKQDVDRFLDDMVNSLTGTNDIKFFNGLKEVSK